MVDKLEERLEEKAAFLNADCDCGRCQQCVDGLLLCEAANALRLPTPTEDARSRVKVLEEALEWYAEQTRGCRKIGRDGDAFRQALDRDGGQLARTALGNKETDRHG